MAIVTVVFDKKKYKLDDEIDRQKIDKIRESLSTSVEYSTDSSLNELLYVLSDKIDALRCLSLYNDLYDVAIEMLYDLYKLDSSSLNHIKAYDYLKFNGDVLNVPACFNDIARLSSYSRGDAIGNGEILASLMFKDFNRDVSAHAKYDCNINGDNVHIKYLSLKSKSVPIGRQDNDSTWKQNDAYKLCCELADSSNYGLSIVKTNTDAFMTAICKKYNTDDPLIACDLLQNDLDSCTRTSKSMGDVKYFLFLKQRSDDDYYFERVDLDYVHFYSVSQDSIKISQASGRYRQCLESIIKKSKEKNDVIVQLEKKKNDAAERARIFCDLWNSSNSLSELSTKTLLSKRKLQARKQTIIKSYKLDFKKFNRSTKNESRTNRDIGETYTQGSLEFNY